MIETPLDIDALEAASLKLNHADRSRLMERLIVSLDIDPEVEAAWEQEADRREAELATDEASTVPFHEAMARLQARIAR